MLCEIQPIGSFDCTRYFWAIVQQHPLADSVLLAAQQQAATRKSLILLCVRRAAGTFGSCDFSRRCGEVHDHLAATQQDQKCNTQHPGIQNLC